MGIFLAGLIAALVVLGLEQIDTTFHSVDDLQQFTSRVLAGHVANTRRQAGT